jgi:4-hydroxy-tetrahydrodipicolinate reductase
MSAISTPIIIHGASGRMGSRTAHLAQRDDAFNVVALVSHARSPALEPSARAIAQGAIPLRTPHDLGSLPQEPAVIVDFSSPEGVVAACELARRFSAALLVGTTGLDEPARAAIDTLARTSAVLVAPNTSLGVAAVARAVRDLARALGPAFDAGIIEVHHTKKKDAPSGTAIRLASALAEGGRTLPPSAIAALRVGDVVGEHTVRFVGPDETIEVIHRAGSRDLFARGALRAAAWLASRPPGRYTMSDVLAIDG